MQSTSATLAAALQPPRPVSTLGKLSTGSDSKRHTRKENNFVLKYGQRHHSYDSEKAPYPLSYDRHVLELESLDNHFTKHLRSGSVSFVNHEEVPERVLDLGCGMGTWVIDAAKQWPDCELVGFDLVNIQIPVAAVDPLLAKRITWVHGNFLTTRLPFEEDEFDHVHIQSIAQGVPENKWDNLFDEINRVLRPGGSVEIIEDDAVFPYLPRWFTAPMRARPRRTTFPEGSQRGYPSLSDIPGHNIPSHDHALLESLYNAVFQHRFINMRPSSLLPNYFISYFRHCTLGPVISYPMPAIPPLQPLPTQIVNAHSKDMSPENADSRISTFFPVISSDVSSAIPSVRPPSMSFSSTISSCSTVQSSTYESSLSSLFSFSGREKSGSVSTTASNGLPLTVATTTESSLVPPDPEKLSSERLARTPTPVPRLNAPYMLESSSTDLTAVPSIPSALFSKDRLVSLNERSLAMHLFRSYQIVLACREALWEELKDRIRNRREELTPFGWEDDDDFEETQNRKKFEKLLERYQNDMQARCALWCSLNNIGWPFPPREPLSKAELIEEERMREAMVEARQQAPLEEQQVPCRTTRVLVGFKPQ